MPLYHQIPKALMVQGTTSDAGKSVIVTAICHWLARQGESVAPFKPQNMALNSAVTADGGEIGRAQAVQAQACGIKPTTDMNPVLIKPNTDTQAQIIINGKARHDMGAKAFHDFKPQILDEVISAFQRLQSQYDYVIVEGAGSPAEINLRDRDIANMGFAEAADIPVVIVADIDRGGVFAHLYGTLALLSESEQARVVGFIINRFRGDIALLTSGLDWLEEQTGKPVLGVIPYLHGLHIDAEDAINAQQIKKEETKLRVVIPVLTRTSNHTDFDALRVHPDIDISFVGRGQRLEKADLIIIPGTKSVRQDLAYLKSQGWDKDIARHLRYGGKLLGICGGYQMLGERIIDHLGVEGAVGTSEGLGYLPLFTELQADKCLRQVTGVLSLPGQDKAEIKGYEIHAGMSTNYDDSFIQPLTIDGQKSGLLTPDEQILGVYVHGLFDQPEALFQLMSWAGAVSIELHDNSALQTESFSRIADTIEQYIDFSKIK